MTGPPASDPPVRSTAAPWQAVVLTILPEMFPGPFAFSLAATALERGLWTLKTIDIREFARDKHRSVDDQPFGGGPGMVMRPDVVDSALAAIDRPGPIIYLSPRGRPLDQPRVKALAAATGVVLLCGRFEGIDQRVLDAWRVEEVSLGDFVLAGGEVAAMALLEACVRLLPGVVGAAASLAEESFESGLLEYPHYTRPQLWHDAAGRAHEVPEVLASGHHARVAAWRRQQAEAVTRTRRPDLWARYVAARKGSAGFSATETGATETGRRAKEGDQ